MVWRLLGGFFGITFLIAGFSVAVNAQDSCARVTLVAAERRTIGYTCWSEVEWENRHEYELVDESGATRAPPDTAVPAMLVALVAFAIGGVLLVLGVWPLLRMVLLRGEGPKTEDEILRDMAREGAAREPANAKKAKRPDDVEPKEMPWDRAARERAAAREAKRAAEHGSPERSTPEGTRSGRPGTEGPLPEGDGGAG